MADGKAILAGTIDRQELVRRLVEFRMKEVAERDRRGWNNALLELARSFGTEFALAYLDEVNERLYG